MSMETYLCKCWFTYSFYYFIIWIFYFYRHKYNNTETSLQSVIEVHEKACRDIQFNDNGDTLYSVSKDKSIMITDFNTQKLKGIYENAHE